MSLATRKRVGLALSAALFALACASFELPAIPPRYDSDLPPHKSYAGVPRARDRIAVILVQTNADRAGMPSLALRSIDAAPVPPATAYAVLPGSHTLEVQGRLTSARAWTARTDDVAATLEVEVGAGGLHGLRVGPPGKAGVEFVDLRGGAPLVSARLETLPTQAGSCGLGFEVVLPLALLAAWRRRARSARRRARPLAPLGRAAR